MPDTDFGHYVCQQAIYAHILERNYGINVTSMRLVQFHPTALDAECRVIEIDDSFREVAAAIVQQRIEEMAPPATQAEPSQAEPSQAEPSQAEPTRPSRARPSRARPSRLPPWPSGPRPSRPSARARE